MFDDLYGCLGLPPKSSLDDIKKAYKKLALIYHPDKQGTGNRETFEKIHQAYVFLKEPKNKRIYDAAFEDGDSEVFTRLFDKVMDMMSEHLKKCKKTTAKRAPRPVTVKAKVSLDEIYNCEIKKLVLRVRRGEAWQKVPFYIDLTQHDQKIFKFEGQGDEAYGVKSDMLIELDIQPHPTVKRDSIISEHDLYIESTFSLYEYYNGLNKSIPFLCNENINVLKTGKLAMSEDFYTYTHCVAEKGLPYICEDKVQYGNLYIYFRLKLPEQMPNCLIESKE